MTFAHPALLWLLLVFPPGMIAFFWWSWRKRQRLMTQFIQSRLLSVLTVGISVTRQKIRAGCLVLGVACLILALARPQWGFDWEASKQRGLDIVVAIDTSKSMLAEDIVPNRLARAKLAALDLMQQAKSDRLGLVAFAGSAFLQCPLTIDDVAFRQSVEALDVNIIPQGGTALAEAIETAALAFKEGEHHRALVMFTDGEDQDSGAVAAAKKAGEGGLQIFTIGIGSTEGGLLPVKDAKGRMDYVRDEQGNVHQSRLNETLLREIAGATEKGFYLPLQGARTIDTLYAQGLAPLPKSESSEKLIKRFHERYHWPLALAIVLLIAEMLFPERKRESRSRAPASAPTKAAVREAVALLVLFLLPATVFGSASSALREYKAGQYDQALKDYEKLIERDKDDPRLHFNAGAAAYRNRNFEEAAKQFNEALVSPDLNLQAQAYYNRGNTLFHLGENNAEPGKRNEVWKKSLEDFQSALKLGQKLNRPDADAQFNYEFVKKRLEELKQQQQQSKQDKSDQQQNQDQQQQQNQGEQSKKDQDQNSQSQPNKSEQSKSEPKQDPSQQNQAAKQQKQEQNQQPANQSEKQKEQQQQASQSSGQEKENSDEKERESEAAAAAGQMTPQQAQQLLDSQKNQEMMLPPVQPQQKPVDRSRPIRDW